MASASVPGAIGRAFVPRSTFPRLDSLPRSYFLGHHRSGLREMQKTLASIDLVIECRDYRVPITSRNPLLEDSVLGKQRLILYTKHDLGRSSVSPGKKKQGSKQDQMIRNWHMPTPVLFSDFRSPRSVQSVLEFAKRTITALDGLTGARMMVIGMPNVGKSSLLNALRMMGTGKGKAAHTGAQPGVTRKVGNEVRICGDSKTGDALYLVDTPGVFVPHMPDPESMLKLALCGSVKDTIISPTILADYLLYRLNLENPSIYSQYCEPTNQVEQFLQAAAQKTGRLQKGGVPDTEAAAIWLVQRWRTGHLGRFLLDSITESSLEARLSAEEEQSPSISGARKAAQEAARQRRLAAAT